MAPVSTELERQTRGNVRHRSALADAEDGSCSNETSRLIARVGAAGRYEGALREIIHAFKYGGRRSLAYPLATLMRERGEAILRDADVAVAVPLYILRRCQRGFNQADDLAALLGLPVVRALRRRRSTRPQADLAAADRRQNVHNAFVRRRRASALKDAVVVIVDDVMTTGATLDACALALEGVGVREIRALTAARVVTKPH
ncbi:MAG: ComF family protein [Vicinamibacterales bacterium]